MPDDPPSAVESPPAPGRKRRILRRALKYAAATFTILAIAYAALCIWYYRQTPKLTRNYTAELNATTLKVPPEKRAWTHYRRALEVLEPRQENEFADNPGDKDWPTTSAYLKRNAKAIEMLREAAKIRPLGVLYQEARDPADAAWRARHEPPDENGVQTFQPNVENPSLWGRIVQHFGALLKIVRTFESDAVLAASEGDQSRLAANLHALLDIAEQLAEGKFTADELTAGTFADIAVNATYKTLGDAPASFASDDLKSLSHRLLSIVDGGMLNFREDRERLLVADYLQRQYTDEGAGNGVYALDSAWGDEYAVGNDDDGEDDEEPLKEYWDRLRAPFWACFVMPDRRELEAANDRYLHEVDRILALAPWQRKTAIEAIAMEGFTDVHPVYHVYDKWRGRRILSPIGLVSIRHNADARRKQKLGALLIGLAVHRHQRAHGKWPKSLDDLDAELLATVPLDQFTGKPLLYKLVNNQPTIYSVGADLDDDGGNPPTPDEDHLGYNASQFDLHEPPPDGDWILFPPYKEPPLADEANEEANNQADDNANDNVNDAMEDAANEQPAAEDDVDSPEVKPPDEKASSMQNDFVGRT
jgi:hypothetical protein